MDMLTDKFEVVFHNYKACWYLLKQGFFLMTPVNSILKCAQTTGSTASTRSKKDPDICIYINEKVLSNSLLLHTVDKLANNSCKINQ